MRNDDGLVNILTYEIFNNKLIPIVIPVIMAAVLKDIGMFILRIIVIIGAIIRA